MAESSRLSLEICVLQVKRGMMRSRGFLYRVVLVSPRDLRIPTSADLVGRA